MRNENKQQLLRTVGILIFATAVGCAAGAVALVGLAVLFTGMSRLPQTVLLPLTVAVCAFSAFFGGFAAGRLSGRRGWLFGLMTGVLLAIVLFLCSLSVTGDSVSGLFTAKLLVILLFGVFGGIIGVHRKRRLR